jgi:signal transduction histidine kinase/membrane protease YdiL (CAAX protease family)
MAQNLADVARPTHRLAVFLSLTFGFSWGLWIVAVALGGDISEPVVSVLYNVASAGPSLAALFLALTGRRGARQARAAAAPRWLPSTLLLGLLPAIGAATLAPLVGGPGLDLGVFGHHAAAAGGWLAYLGIALVNGPLNEEFGWRGYAQPLLRRTMSARRAPLVLGPIWGLWHVPLFFLVGTSQHAMGLGSIEGVGFFAVLVLQSVCFQFVSERLRGGVPAAVLLHLLLNTAIAVVPLDSIAVALTYLGITVLVAVAVLRFGLRKTSEVAVDAVNGRGALSVADRPRSRVGEELLNKKMTRHDRSGPQRHPRLDPRTDRELHRERSSNRVLRRFHRPDNAGVRKRMASIMRWVMTRHQTPWDAAIAAVCFVITVAGSGVISDARPFVFVFAAVSAFPLVWRRRAPFLVAMVCGVGSIGLIVVHGQVDWPYGQIVATYTVAAASPFVARAVLVVLTAVGILFTQQTGGQALGAMLTSGGVFATAFALGTGARARRSRIALLEERTRRLAEERESAAARERQAIARDMHDIVAHSISLIAVQAEAGPLLVHDDPERAARAFDTIADTAHDALSQLRRTLGVLRSGLGETAPQPDLTGIPALAEQARQTGLTVTFTERGEPGPVPATTAVAAYRVVQESLTNVVRHAQAGVVRIGFDWSPERLQVVIADDGHGAAGGGSAAGHGLIGMRERVTACGGDFGAGTASDGSGFVVTAVLPLLTGRNDQARTPERAEAVDG